MQPLTRPLRPPEQRAGRRATRDHRGDGRHEPAERELSTSQPQGDAGAGGDRGGCLTVIDGFGVGAVNADTGTDIDTDRDTDDRRGHPATAGNRRHA
jgi:hypothetical protein